VTGDTAEQLDLARTKVKETIAFYGSTPSYRGVLDHHGWGDVQPELTALSRAGRWSEMGALVDDTMLAQFAVVGDPEEAGGKLAARFGDLVDRITLYTPYDIEDDVLDRVTAAVRAMRSVIRSDQSIV
jgi:hypothetical protein